MRESIREALMGIRSELQAKKAAAYNEENPDDKDPKLSREAPREAAAGRLDEPREDKASDPADAAFEREKIEFMAKRKRPKAHETLMIPTGKSPARAPAPAPKMKGKGR